MLATALGMPASNGLTAVERPDVVFKSGLVALGLSVLLVPFLVAEWGVMGAARRMPVYAAAAELPGLRTIVRILAMGTEAIIGRDLLNRMVARLDGPAAAVSVERPPRRRR